MTVIRMSDTILFRYIWMTGEDVQPERDDRGGPGESRRCEFCGEMTPAGLSYCVHCGALSREALEAAQESRVERRFFGALAERPTPVTIAILGLNIVIYLLMVLIAGRAWFSNLVNMSDVGTLIAFGAKTNELLRQGDWYRLITPIFLHGGLLHLATNSWAIYVIGPLVEKLYGSSRYLLLYLLSGIGGVIGSYVGGLSGSQTIPGVGASGAIFGLFGALLIFAWKYRTELPPRFRKSIKSGILPVIVINLFIGFSIPFIDNAAHIGGLITGAALAFLIPYLAPGSARVSAVGLLILTGCILLVAASFTAAFRSSDQYLARRADNIQQFLDAIGQAEDVTVRFVRAASRPQDAERTSDLRPELLAAASRLEAAGAPDPRAEAIRQDCLDLIRSQLAALDSPAPNVEQTASRLLRIREDFKKWVVSDGEKYGLKLKGTEQVSGFQLPES